MNCQPAPPARECPLLAVRADQSVRCFFTSSLSRGANDRRAANLG